MWIGWIEFDLLLGDVQSRKLKRSLIRPLVSDLRRQFQVAAAETDYADLYRRGGVGVTTLSSHSDHVIDVLDHVEGYVANRPEMELLSTRRRLLESHDV